MFVSLYVGGNLRTFSSDFKNSFTIIILRHYWVAYAIDGMGTSKFAGKKQVINIGLMNSFILRDRSGEIPLLIG